VTTPTAMATVSYREFLSCFFFVALGVTRILLLLQDLVSYAASRGRAQRPPR
jgi:hypothetical protein